MEVPRDLKADPSKNDSLNSITNSIISNNKPVISYKKTEFTTIILIILARNQSTVMITKMTKILMTVSKINTNTKAYVESKSRGKLKIELNEPLNKHR